MKTETYDIHTERKTHVTNAIYKVNSQCKGASINFALKPSVLPFRFDFYPIFASAFDTLLCRFSNSAISLL